MTQTKSSRARWLEIIAAITLALASLVAAWSTYQAAQWGRTQAIRGNAVVALLLGSTQETTLGSQDAMVDIVTFTSWLQAYSTGNQVLADFYRERFREEFKPAFEAWVALRPLENADAPPSPFAMPEYTPAHAQTAADLQGRAATTSDEVRAASDNAAHYVRNTIFLASALFFVGISRMFSDEKVRLSLEIIAVILLIVGIVNVITGPIA